MAFHVYLVQCADGTLYCGMARDPVKRLAVHNAGRGSKYVRSRRPATLVFQSPALLTIRKALQLEYVIKHLTVKAKRNLINNRNSLAGYLCNTLTPPCAHLPSTA